MEKYRIIVQNITTRKFKHCGQIIVERRTVKPILKLLRKMFKS